ncbi:MAG TPA: sigma-70 family RNA polymerase sigma factor, partial [Labilithrix sp.]
MSVSRPETKTEDASTDDDAPPSSKDSDSQDDLEARSPSTQSRTPPPSISVNLKASDPSKAKQARIREAEEDRVLIAKAQGGDVVAFRQLVERHQRRAFAIALALVRDENDARELVQDAFLRVYKGLNSFQGGSSFFTWLYRIITNLSIDL